MKFGFWSNYLVWLRVEHVHGFVLERRTPGKVGIMGWGGGGGHAGFQTLRTAFYTTNFCLSKQVNCVTWIYCFWGQKGQTNWSKEKLDKNRIDHMTNLIATNVIWEQVKITLFSDLKQFDLNTSFLLIGLPVLTLQHQQRHNCRKIAANSFVTLQSQKDRKRNRPKKKLFIKCWDVIFWLRIYVTYCCLYKLKNPSIRVTRTCLTSSHWIKVNKSVTE